MNKVVRAVTGSAESTIKPHWADRTAVIRLLEITPGAVTWLALLAPIVLSLTQPVWVAYFVIAYDLIWLVKSLRLSFFLVRGYGRLHRLDRVDWQERLTALEDLAGSLRQVEEQLARYVELHPGSRHRFSLDRRQHRRYLDLRRRRDELAKLAEKGSALLNPKQLINAVIIATYNESPVILERSIKSYTEANYPLDRMILIIAYEERGGMAVKRGAEALIKKYGRLFKYAEAIKHPAGLRGEIPAKGGNISYAARRLTTYIKQRGIDPERVIVTTADADNRPSRNYFAYLSYQYVTDPNRIHKSYQPVPMFYNNIWDAPAPMRVIATGSSFWMLMQAMRPHLLRNFSAHAQSLRTLIDTDYWNVASIVEDGHQYWRTYFTYDGDHQVVPLFTPIFQDAVLAGNWRRTFAAQYLQLRRWAWGVSDFPYVVRQAVKNKRISWGDKLLQLGRFFEGHFSWATAPLILSFVAWLPLFLNQEFSERLLAHQLPVIASRILTITMVGLVVTIFISLISLPPRPPRYRRSRHLGMLLQWGLLPFTTLFFGAFAAIDAQTRLMLGRYLDWRVTEKVIKE